MLDPSLDVAPSIEPAYCRSCELRHTRRPDWLCPRCGSPVDSEVPSPAAGPSRRQRRDEEEDFPAGSRVAGAVAALCAAALGAGLAAHPLDAHRWPIVGAAAVLVSLGLGASLGIPWARWGAVGSAVVGGVVLAEELVRERLPGLVRDPLPAALRGPLRELLRPLHPWTILLVLAFLAGGLLLLAGRPQRGRLAAGVVLAAPLVVAQALRALGR